MQVVILAGGKGTRLKPFTNIIPKPLVPLGEKPILEIILRQLKAHGATRITIAVNHLAHLIKTFFGDGSELGLDIQYSLEDKVLGTAGPLKLVKDLDENFLVMNGDLLTTIDFKDLYQYHENHSCDITIGTFPKEVKIDLGVIDADGDDFVNYTEKPTLSYLVSMGIYAMNRKVVEWIPVDEKYDLPDLVLSCHHRKGKIKCYRGNYEWLDIGRIEDYEQAVLIFEENHEKYLKE